MHNERTLKLQDFDPKWQGEEMKFRFVSTMEVNVSSAEEVEAVASRLRDAFNDVGIEYPAMTRYLVRVVSAEKREIEIGIQLEDVNQKYADDLADEILDALIQRVSPSDAGDDDRSSVALNQSSTLEFA